LRSNLGSSALVRLFAPWVPQPESRAACETGPGGDVAERLSQWVSAFEAIELQAAQQSIRAIATASPGPSRQNVRAATGLAEDFQRARATLARAISLDAALPNEFTYAPYKRRHFELQRQMDQLLSALRDHVRQALSRTSPELRQLAALDAALHKVIAPREQALLPAATALLERRFEQLRRAHLEEVKATGLDDDPATWRQPGRWLHAFDNEWRQALLAELDLRLEPIAGLVEAGGCELKNS